MAETTGATIPPNQPAITPQNESTSIPISWTSSPQPEATEVKEHSDASAKLQNIPCPPPTVGSVIPEAFPPSNAPSSPTIPPPPPMPMISAALQEPLLGDPQVANLSSVSALPPLSPTPPMPTVPQVPPVPVVPCLPTTPAATVIPAALQVMNGQGLAGATPDTTGGEASMAADEPQPEDQEVEMVASQQPTGDVEMEGSPLGMCVDSEDTPVVAGAAEMDTDQPDVSEPMPTDPPDPPADSAVQVEMVTDEPKALPSELKMAFDVTETSTTAAAADQPITTAAAVEMSTNQPPCDTDDVLIEEVDTCAALEEQPDAIVVTIKLGDPHLQNTVPHSSTEAGAIPATTTTTIGVSPGQPTGPPDAEPSPAQVADLGDATMNVSSPIAGNQGVNELPQKGPPPSIEVDPEGRWMIHFASSGEVDTKAVLQLPAFELLHHIHGHLSSWHTILSKRMIPEGDLPPRAIKALVSITLRLFSAETCRDGTDQQLHAAIVNAMGSQSSPFLTTTIPAFIRSRHCGASNAVVVAQLCTKLATCLSSPADDLKEVAKALKEIQEKQPLSKRDERLEIAISKLHSTVASRPGVSGDWATPMDPEEERRRKVLSEVLPTRDDFFYPHAFHPSQLPVNLVQGLFRSADDYYNTQYQLLRAEYFSNYIHGVHLKKFADSSALYQLSPTVRHSVENGGYLYNSLRVVGTVYHPGLPGSGVAVALQFRGPDPSLFDWGTTGCLQRGSLVCISPSDLLPHPCVPFSSELFWGVVVDRDPRLLAFGLVVIQLLFHTPTQLASALGGRQPGVPTPEPIMLENPLCFAGAQTLLRQLKFLRDDASARGPFVSLFVEGDPPSDGPPYLRGVDLTPILLPLGESLDVTQRHALQSMGERCVLLQGPAGTGKSHVAAKMVQAVLILKAESHVRKQLEESAACLGANEQRLSNLKNGMEQVRNSGEPDTLGRLRMLEEEVRVLSGPTQAYLYGRHAALVAKMAAIERHRAANPSLPSPAESSGPIVVVAECLQALDRFLAMVADDCQGLGPPIAKDIIRISSQPPPPDISSCVADFHTMVMDDLTHQGGPAKQMLERLVDLRNAATSLLNNTLTPEMMNLFATEEQQMSFGPITQETINRWLVDPDFMAKDPTPVNMLLQQLRLLNDDGVTEPPGREVPFTSWLEDGLPRPLFSVRADYYTSLPDYPRISPASFLECFVPLPDPTYSQPLPPSYVDQAANCHTLSVPDRQELTRRWMVTYKRTVQELLPAIDMEYQKVVQEARERRKASIRHVLASAQVVAGTLGSILAHSDVIRELNCCMLVVEDTPTMLESVLASLLSCVNPQQIVLVGDPVRSRPSLEVTAHGPRNFVDAPAFERFASNGFTGHVLTTQYRMATPVQRLSLMLYGSPPLEDHVPSVLQTRSGERAVVDGMIFEMYFWTHEHPEIECIFDGQQSWMNMQEVDMAFHLAEFLIAGGLHPTQLAILTPYKAQLLELLARCSDLAGVHIGRLPSAQSIQADVVILSLVTTRRLTEFLRSPHAAAMALTRARYGLYILGSPVPMETLPHWHHVLEVISQPPPEVFDRLSPLHALVKTMVGARLPVVSQDPDQDGTLYFIRPGRSFTHYMTTQLQEQNWRYTSSGMLMYHPPTRGRIVPLQGGFTHLVALRSPQFALPGA